MVSVVESKLMDRNITYEWLFSQAAPQVYDTEDLFSELSSCTFLWRLGLPSAGHEWDQPLFQRVLCTVSRRDRGVGREEKWADDTANELLAHLDNGFGIIQE